MLDVTACYGVHLDFIKYFGNIVQIKDDYSFLKCFIFTKHSSYRKNSPRNNYF